MRYNFSLIIGLIAVSSLIIPAYAHTTVEVGPYEIEVGWGTEPPIVGIRNTIVYEISESPSEGVKSGINNAFRNLEPTIKFGGVTKVLEVNSDPRPGHYFSDIIPTKTGSLSIIMKGEINDVSVDVDIPIEDVESTSVLDFPPTSGSSNQDVAALKNSVSSLQRDVSDLKSNSGSFNSDVVISEGSAYDFAVLGLSLGVAAIILAIIALVKRK